MLLILILCLVCEFDYISFPYKSRILSTVRDFAFCLLSSCFVHHKEQRYTVPGCLHFIHLSYIFRNTLFVSLFPWFPRGRQQLLCYLSEDQNVYSCWHTCVEQFSRTVLSLNKSFPVLHQLLESFSTDTTFRRPEYIDSEHTGWTPPCFWLLHPFAYVAVEGQYWRLKS